MTFREFTGKNVEEAIRSAMKEFGSDLSDLDIEILSQGSRGILGVGGEEARILAAPRSAVAAATSVREPEAPADEPAAGSEPEASAASPDASNAEDADAGDEASEQVAELARAEAGRRGGRGTRGGRSSRSRTTKAAAEPADEPEPVAERPARSSRSARTERPPREERGSREPAPFVPAKPIEELSEQERTVLEEAKAVLEELLRLMDLSGTVEIAMGNETSKLNVKGSDLGVLIGRRGEKLASLQHLVNLIVARREGQHHRIAVDVENYRGRREDQLRDVAKRAAERVVKTGKIIQLESMPAVERRVVHVALVDNPRVRTQSVGVDPNRRIVILPADKVGG